ncbi:MAG: ribosome assembly RNA-binding protein YhbY, partial [Thermoanaerobaculia bacterium]
AHPLAPVVRVGKAGVTESVIAETKKSLASHELIKVRIDVDESAERKSLAEKLASAADAHLAGTVGKIAILYRERDEEPEIELPT